MALDTPAPEGSGNDRFDFLVEGSRYTTKDPILQGRDILQKAGLSPASEYVLIQLTRPGTRSVGLDEDVDLSEPGKEEFRAFASDRTFTFTVDERGYEWGAGTIGEPELRDITGTPDGRVLIFEHEDAEDEFLAADDIVNLAERGTEHLRTGKRLVTVFYADTPFELERRVYTGRELSAIFAVPANYLLDLVKPNDFDEIGPHRRVKVREGMRFVSHPPGGQSS
jgi:hypothetical protein